MKNFVLATLLFLPLPAFSQQVTDFDVCTRNREVYVPGHYDRYGRYVQGHVKTDTYRVPCGSVSTWPPEPAGSAEPHPVPPRVRSRVSCDPARTLLGMTAGGGAAAAMSRGDGYKWSVPLGAVIGGVAFGCN